MYFQPRLNGILTMLLLVTAYTGSNDTTWCDDNGTTIPEGICTPMTIGPYSVDCPGINGTYDPGYTTILASNKSSLPVTTSIPTPSSTTSSTSSIPFSSTNPSLPQTQLSPLRDSGSSASQPSSSPPPSTSTTSSQGREGSGNDGGLSGPSTIAIGVVLPGVGVIVAIFGVWGARRYRREGRVLPSRRWSA